jgi:hypothetical protein
MKFEAGKPKTGGRKKGSPNKATGNLRQFITDFLHNNKEALLNDFKKLSPKDRVLMFEKLLKFALPAMQATSLDINFDQLSDDQLDYVIENLKVKL